MSRSLDKQLTQIRNELSAIKGGILKLQGGMYIAGNIDNSTDEYDSSNEVEGGMSIAGNISGKNRWLDFIGKYVRKHNESYAQFLKRMKKPYEEYLKKHNLTKA